MTDVLDVREVLDRREAAIAEHRSQRSPFEGLSSDLRLAFLGTDHLVRVPVPAPVPGAPPASGPWPEPWRPPAGSRPTADYWDCTSAQWRGAV